MSALAEVKTFRKRERSKRAAVRAIENGNKARNRTGPPTNSDRAGWADTAVIAFAVVTGMEHEDDQTRLQDLLTDLMHWAKAREADEDCPVDFELAMRNARRTYYHEVHEAEVDRAR